MANLGQKDGVFHIRFRFRGKEFKKSLKTREESAAKAVAHLIELTLHRLHTGQLLVPDDVDPGDFIVSGGVIPTIPEPKSPPVIRPTTRAIADKFTEWQRDRIAPTYHYSQAMHLRHLLRH